MDSKKSIQDHVVEVLAGADSPLLAREIVAALAVQRHIYSRAQINSILYGGLSASFTRDSSFRWSLVANPKMTKKNAENRPIQGSKRNRRWTEDETTLAYWVLPSLREISALTAREFPAIAMKLANLLSVETGGREGLANASNLDRAVVEKYSRNPNALELRVAQILSNGRVNHDRSAEIGPRAVEVLRRTKVPLHFETVQKLLVVKDPLGVVSNSLVRDALVSSDGVAEGPEGVFRWTGSNS